MNKKTLIAIGALALLAVVIVAWVIVRKTASPVPSLGGANSSGNTQSSAGKLTDNFVRCDIDGKSVEFTMNSPANIPPRENVSSDPIRGETLFSANGPGVTDIFFNVPGKTPINYTLTKDGWQNYGILYFSGNATNTGDATKSENGDTYQINVTKHEGSTIEGTFSGETTADGSGKKTTFKNCVFKSSLPVREQ